MSAINWATTKTSLDTAIGTADGPDLTLLTDVRARLVEVGTAYDAMWAASAGVDAAKTAVTTAYSTALAAWTSTYTAAHVDADHAARHAESIQATAQASTTAPYIANVAGAEYVLAPSKAISVATDETPIATAAKNLMIGGSPALRVEAIEPGTPGNRIEVRVDDATSGAIKFKLRARLGTTYEETFDELVAGEPVSLDGSRLLASASWFGLSRPDSTGAWVALTGGTGGSFAAVTRRIDRAAQLRAASAQVGALDAYRAALVAAYGARPQFADFGSTSGVDAYASLNRRLGMHYFGRPISVREVESMLSPILTEASALLASATY